MDQIIIILRINHCKPGDSDVQIIGDRQQVDEDPHQRDDETNDDDEEEPRCARTVRWRCTGHANNGKQLEKIKSEIRYCLDYIVMIIIPEIIVKTRTLRNGKNY